MWTHIWMSFTSHTFTSLHLVHTLNQDFLKQRLWLGFLLVREFPHSGNPHMPRLPNLDFSGFPNSADSRFHGLAGSWLRVFTGSRPQELRRFKASDLHRFATLELRRFKASDLRKFATLELRRFQIPDLRKFATSGLRRFKIPENSFHEFHYTRRFEGDRFSWIPQQQSCNFFSIVPSIVKKRESGSSQLSLSPFILVGSTRPAAKKLKNLYLFAKNFSYHFHTFHRSRQRTQLWFGFIYLC
jgi:hypothetical protein